MDLLELREKLKDSFIGRGVLLAASKIYGAGAYLDRISYDNGWKTGKSVNSRVVCIGNITAGGTGKTTAVLLAATTLAKEGIRVAIVSRGYKRQQKTKDVVVLFDNPDADWRLAGDEPFMMSRVLSQYKVILTFANSKKVELSLFWWMRKTRSETDICCLTAICANRLPRLNARRWWF